MKINRNKLSDTCTILLALCLPVGFITIFLILPNITDGAVIKTLAITSAVLISTGIMGCIRCLNSV